MRQYYKSDKKKREESKRKKKEEKLNKRLNKKDEVSPAPGLENQALPETLPMDDSTNTEQS